MKYGEKEAESEVDYVQIIDRNRSDSRKQNTQLLIFMRRINEKID